MDLDTGQPFVREDVQSVIPYSPHCEEVIRPPQDIHGEAVASGRTWRGEERSIAFASWALLKREQKYSQFDKKALALIIIWSQQASYLPVWP